MSKPHEILQITPVPAKNARDRLIDAAVEMIGTHGEAACSARRIGEKAGIAASTINYAFGRIERLFSSAYEQAATLSAEWLENRRAALARLPHSPALAAFFLQDTIQAWTGPQRQLALLYQECHTAKAPCLAQWSAAFRNFWEDVATHLGLSAPAGGLMYLQFEAEALYHLSQWDNFLETAALRESCSYFVQQWLGLAGEPVGGAIASATATLSSQPGWTASGTAAAIAQAAAAVVGQDGLAGLTHRAVASRAAATLGAVTYHFPTVEALVAGAVWGQVLGITDGPEALKVRRHLSQDLRSPGIFDTVMTIASARRKLFLAGIRRADLAAPCATIRFAHGGTSRTIAAELDGVAAECRAAHASVGSRLLTTIGLLLGDGAIASSDELLGAVLKGFVPQP